MALLDVYHARIAEGSLRADARQAEAAARLSALADGLQETGNGFLARLFQPSTALRGIYLYGAVGRGKTMLMDMFFADVRMALRRRVHFHAFMQDVHARLHGARRKVSDAIGPVASAIAGEAKLLCLDEMQIGDIADAMIVGRLFEALLAKGTIVVTTSNMAPEDLYAQGLNRQLFLPFIELMRNNLDVVELKGDTDYRLGRVKGHETFITPLGPAADEKMQELWLRLTDTERGAPVELDILGRRLSVPEAAHACARFTFAELCGAPLGPADYLALVRSFRALFVERIPGLGPSSRNEAIRFEILIDTLYDAQVRLVASSANPPESVFSAGSQFARTISRLKEMQSASWWGKKIVET